MVEFDRLLAVTGEIGYVTEATQSVVRIEGLPEAILGEQVRFDSGQIGQIVSMAKDNLEALVLSVVPVTVGVRVARSGSRLAVEVGEHLLGTTVNSLGK